MNVTRAALLRLIETRAETPLSLRELVAAFGGGRVTRALLQELLAELVAEGGLVHLRGNRYGLPAGASGQTGALSVHPDGYGFVLGEEGRADVYVPARSFAGAMHGDRVEVRIVARRPGGRQEGSIVRVLTRAQARVVGRFRQERSVAYVLPDDPRLPRAIFVPPRQDGGAKAGQVVVAEITAYPSGQREAEGRVVEVLGWPDDPITETLMVIRRLDLPDRFAPATLAEARKAPQEVPAAALAGRTDLRGLPFVTIDGETARDFDDAVAVRREVGGSIRLWVAIADVAHYVAPGSRLDAEAYARGTSVYFPDRCLPMLPEELSNGICSLNPEVDRLTLAAELLFDAAGVRTSASFAPAVICSRARLTYPQVSQALADQDPTTRTALGDLTSDLDLMAELAQRLLARRQQRGSLDFDLPEPEIILDLQGGIQAIVRSERTIAHRLIEEFMLAANEAVAEFLAEQELPFLYRIHEPPDPAKLAEFRELAASFGLQLDPGPDGVTPGALQRLLEAARGRPEERLINQVLLRCLQQARYAAENRGHFGLASPCYTHFTSPIRRYPDLVVHRVLRAALAGQPAGREVQRTAAQLPETALHTSRRERVALEAEREVVLLRKLQFMADRVGEEFDGHINGVTPTGFFVELDEMFVDGFVPVVSLKDDWYAFREGEHLLAGERTGRIFRLGDPLRVRVVHVSRERRQIEFVPVLQGRVLVGRRIRPPAPGRPKKGTKWPRRR